MHESALRGLRRLLLAAAVLVAGVAAALVVLRACRSEEERLSDLIDEARDALVEGRRDEFLGHFAEVVRYRGNEGRASLERDLDRFLELRTLQVTLAEREVTVDGDRARARIRADVGHVFQGWRAVDVRIEFERRDGAWKVVSLDRTAVEAR